MQDEMLPDDSDFESVSSFQFPVPVPTTEPGAGVQWQVCFNVDYLPIVLGCLFQAMQDTAWQSTDPTVLLLAQERVNELIYLFQQGCNLIVPGMIMLWGGTTTPDGWLPCDGSAVSRTTYAALFAVLATHFGAGNGTTTFNVPDFQAHFPLGVGSFPSGTGYTIGASGGEEKHTLTATEMPSHTHPDNGHAHAALPTLNGVAATPGPLAVLLPSFIPTFTGVGNAALANTGGGASHNNIPPFQAVNYIIKW